VTWLEIDPRNPQITIKPITANSTSMRGTNPLITINSESNAVAMINGGFFNRNNSYLWEQFVWMANGYLDQF